MAMTTANSTLLTRQEIWSNELKEVLKDDLMAQSYVRMLDGFPDGETFTIPSIGDARTDDYVEDTGVSYRPLDTGEFQFSITEYLSSGTYITKKAEQDMFYMNELVSSFVPKQRRAIMEHFETTALAAPEVGVSANSQETIDGAHHRFSGGNSGVIELADFAAAMYALKKANVPQENMVAVVDPSTEFIVNTLTSIVGVSDNPMWQGIVETGMGRGMRFIKNIYGFDVYTSNYLPSISDSALPDRGGANAVDYSSTNGKANYFFSASSDILPLVGAWRQEPEVDMEYNKDFQRTEFVTTARYGVKLYRPENIVMVASTPTIS
jgi:hypothetical protein